MVFIVPVVLFFALLAALSEQVVRELRNGDQRAVKQLSGVALVMVSLTLFLLTGLSGLVMGVTVTIAVLATAHACRDERRWARLLMVVLTATGSLIAGWAMGGILVLLLGGLFRGSSPL
jgi:membrane-associated HD superfamily phosphohydrolase